jgi:hypothetical protein
MRQCRSCFSRSRRIQATHRRIATWPPATPHMGRLDDAGKIVERLRAITPLVVPNASFLRNPEHRELFLPGLRLAMGGEA